MSQRYSVERVDSLVLHPDNPNRGDVEVLRESVRANGFYGYVLAQESTRHVIAGNHRLKAAVEEGVAKIPVFWLDVDDDAARRIMIADNRVTEFSGTDLVALREALVTLEDLDGSGYGDHVVAEIDALLAEGSLPEGEGGPSTATFNEPVPPDLHDTFWTLLEGEADEEFEPRFRRFLDGGKI